MANQEMEWSRETRNAPPVIPDNPPPPHKADDLEHRGRENRDLDPGPGIIDFGTERADRMVGTAQDDQLSGLGGPDTIFGLEGNDTLKGGSGNDTIHGGLGEDTIFGEIGNDRLFGDEGGDTISGGAGNDRVFGGEGNDKLFGGANDDVVEGEIGNDSLFGNSGNDTLRGGSGTDVLTGGIGADVLTGGADKDFFVFESRADSPGHGQADLITDFQHGVDKIDLSAIDANVGKAGNQGFKFVEFDPDKSIGVGEVSAHFDARIGKTVVEVGVDSTTSGPDMRIELQGNVQVDAQDFVFFNNHA